VTAAGGKTAFLGYDATRTAEARIVALLGPDGPLEVAEAGQPVEVILDRTPFYGESGGQLGDTGAIRSAGARFDVSDTQKKLGDLHAHVGRLSSGTLRVGDAVELAVDGERRAAMRANHSATHLLHAALREVLGPHVAQKGSLVNAERLRIDFSHSKPVSADELARIETLVNAQIRGNAEVITRLMTPEAAVEAGAMALFGEKYGDEVRVVSMGRNRHGAGKPVYSLELCGGTHVSRTGDIGLIKVVSESASAAGVRRIEALAGPAARAYLVEQDRRVLAAAAALKAPAGEIVTRIESLLEERRKLEKDLADAKKRLALGGGSGAAADEGVTEVNGVKLMARVLHGISPNEMKGLIDEGKAKLGSGVVALVGVNEEGRAGLIVGVTDDLTKRFNAVDLVKAGVAAVGGQGGGGRPDMAQAGGPDGARAEEALVAVIAALG